MGTSYCHRCTRPVRAGAEHGPDVAPAGDMYEYSTSTPGEQTDSTSSGVGRVEGLLGWGHAVDVLQRRQAKSGEVHFNSLQETGDELPGSLAASS